MAWDFSTEPEFQAKLDWIRDFVARGDLSEAEKRRILWDNPRRLYGVE